jgi:S-DNA-T family DNA segregation ATPase FtsK/SpoIIIE
MARMTKDAVIVPEPPVSIFKLRYVFYIIAALFILLALFSHNQSDFSVIQGGADVPVNNWIGEVGAYLSCTMLYMFGLAAYPIVFILVACALRSLLPLPTSRHGYSGALLLLVLGITVLFAIAPQSFVDQTELLGIGRRDVPNSALSGGVVGQVLAAPEYANIPAGWIRKLIGTVGTTIAAAIFVLAGFVMIWIADWQPAIRWMINLNSLPESERRINAPEPPAEKTAVVEKKIEPGAGLLELRQQAALVKKEEPEPLPVKTPPPPPPIPQPEVKPEPLPVKTPPPVPVKKSTAFGEYTLPLVAMLNKGAEHTGENRESLEHNKNVLQQTMESFGVDGRVTGYITGPRVTRFEVSLSPGVKVEKMSGLNNNFAMELAAESIRILAPIPGRNVVGVEVPNAVAEAVHMRSIMETEQWVHSKAEIPIILGKDVSGKPVVMDLAKAPHLLIAGSTGSGKSVCMNTLIMSLLFKFSPEDLRLILVDPKIVEMEMYKTLPHLITPVVNDAQKVPLALRWAVNEMEKRYRVLAKAGTKNLAGFNSRPVTDTPELDDADMPIPARMPILIIIIDELADIMMTDAKSDVETQIARIAQKGRAAGIHIVIATQRPSVNIITGVIKANLPTRIAFKVSNITDSRVILDQQGADKLLGRGDMLFAPPGSGNLERIQGAMIDDKDIAQVVKLISSQAEQTFDQKVVEEEEEDAPKKEKGTSAPAQETEYDNDLDDDVEASPLVQKYLRASDSDIMRKALEVVLLERKASTSYIQRRLSIGYNRAAEIMDELEKRGMVSPPLPGGSKRDILVFDEVENPGIR